jgi:putative spermidine/putrescine transport system permease protein
VASQPALPAAAVSSPGEAATLAAARVLKRSPSRAKSADWPLALPLAALFIACFVAPLMVLVGVSAYAEPAMRTLSFAQYTKFFGDAFNLGILWSTMVLGVKATLVCLLFGYPIAWICARAPARWQSVLVFLVVLPILTSVVVRTFSWIVILGREGVLNHLLRDLHLIDAPIRLLFTETGVIMVLAQVQMPLMVLPLLATLSRIDPNLADASAALGAGQWRTFFRVTLPLSAPGLISGCILVFSACVTAFVTQTLIGGARLVYMPLHIYQQAVGANNWPFAAAISVVFMLAVLIVIYALTRVGRMSRAYE